VARPSKDFSRRSALLTIELVNARGPGIVKVRSVPPLRRRELSLVTLTEAFVRDWLEASDVVSEGARTDDGAYFGTTSIVIVCTNVETQAPVANALAVDPHMRVRALRIALREARGRGADGTLYAEFSIRRNERGIVVTIDVEARAHASRVCSTEGARRTLHP
jgi:hypothetical protein